MLKLENLESYPPMFHQNQQQDPNQNQKEMKRETYDPNHNPNSNLELESGLVDPIPVIDMECLDEGELDRACREWGILRLVNHGIPTKLIEALQEHAKRIFQMPFETKQGLRVEETNPLMKYFWGTPALTPSGVALPRGGGTAPQNVDWVEGFNVPLSFLSSSIDHHLHHDHLFDFSQLLEEYGRHLWRLGSAVFEAMMRCLKKEVNQPSLYLDESTGLVRVYRYPMCTSNAAESHVHGMHVHTDSSVFSILCQDHVGGLHFLKDDQWFHVKPIPNTLVVNLGDMMQALSDDEYKSVKHKVELNEEKERVSICYFVFPKEDTILHTSKYKPFAYNDFRAQVQLDVKAFGTKIGLDRFRIN